MNALFTIYNAIDHGSMTDRSSKIGAQNEKDALLCYFEG